ncbi:hypothetical protein HYSC106933_09385 [Hydrogenibacillus schlegelii]
MRPAETASSSAITARTKCHVTSWIRGHQRLPLPGTLTEHAAGFEFKELIDHGLENDRSLPRSRRADDEHVHEEIFAAPEKTDGDHLLCKRGRGFCLGPETGTLRTMAEGGLEEKRGSLKMRCPAKACGLSCAGVTRCPVARGWRIRMDVDRRFFSRLHAGARDGREGTASVRRWSACFPVPPGSGKAAQAGHIAEDGDGDAFFEIEFGQRFRQACSMGRIRRSSFSRTRALAA